MPLEVKKEIWKSILLALRPRIREADFLTWFKNTAVLRVDTGVLTIGVPNAFARNVLAGKYHREILEVAREIREDVSDLAFEVEPGLANDGDERITPLGMITGLFKKKERREQVAGVEIATDVRTRALSARYTFDNFVPGTENQLAVAAFRRVADRPGAEYNPLFVYSTPGLGKTHLLQAAGNEMTRAGKLVAYSNAERFLEEFVRALSSRDRNKAVDSFRSKYRRVDALILDDIQFFAGKDKIQEELFHSMETLRDSGKQVILSSDRRPRELGDMDERLLSRFEGGMVVNIDKPGFETRLAIAREFAARERALIPGAVLEAAAHRADRSVRQLEGVLTQLIARMNLLESAPTIGMLDTIIPEVERAAEVSRATPLPEARISGLTAEQIIEAVCHQFGITERRLRSRCRKRDVVVPRQVAMYLIKEELREPFEKIGAIFGGTHHTTVMHSVSKINAELAAGADSPVARAIYAMRTHQFA